MIRLLNGTTNISNLYREIDNKNYNNDEDKVRKYIQERYYVYLKNKPLARIREIDKFSNYIGFLYENGMIPADRLLNVDSESYIFDAIDFESDIKLDKQALRRKSIIKPINHVNNWEKKLEKIINMDTTDECISKGKQLIKNTK